MSFQPANHGGLCQKGYFCPEGSSAMVQCKPGFYCQTNGLKEPTGLCKAGYYCPLGSSSPTEKDCPIGSFCIAGSGVPDLCGNGTYGSVTNLASEAACTPCNGGSYCNGLGRRNVSGPCLAGV